MIAVYEMVEAGAEKVKASRDVTPTQGSSGSVMEFTTVKEKDEVNNKLQQVDIGTKVFRSPQWWSGLGMIVVMGV